MAALLMVLLLQLDTHKVSASQTNPGASLENRIGENALILHRKIWWATCIHMAREVWARRESLLALSIPSLSWRVHPTTQKPCVQLQPSWCDTVRVQENTEAGLSFYREKPDSDTRAALGMCCSADIN